MRQITSFLIFFLCLGVLPSLAQNAKISGKVTMGSSGEALPGVAIVISGTTTGTVTDIDGNYSIEAPADATLDFVSIGLTSVKMPVAGKTSIDVTMTEEYFSLDEVVAIGYGTQKKSVSTGATGSISSKEIVKTPALRVDQALQGRVTGVYVATESGKPGAGSTMRIRGTGTTGDNNPLYIVDGVVTGGIDAISPSDIESIEVLKDAASAAIYGARAANGVILITTRKGKAGESTITYDGYYGVQSAAKKIDLLNAYEYAVIQNEAYAASNKPAPLFTDSEVEALRKNPEGTNWQDQIFENAPIQNHSVSLTGGTDKATYATVLSYFGQEGIVGGDLAKFERINYRFNSTREAKDWLTVGNNIMYAHQWGSGFNDNSEWTGAPIMQSINMPPTVPVYNADGTYGQPNPAISEVTNPLGTLSVMQTKYNVDRVTANTWGEIKFMEGLKWRTNVAIDFAYVNSKTFDPIYNFTPVVNNLVNSIYASKTRHFTLKGDSYLTYDKKIEDHSLNAVLGVSGEEYQRDDVNGNREDLLVDNIDEAVLDMGRDLEAQDAWGGEYKHRILSAFGRLNYNYKEKYLVSGTLRADGSSNFGPNNKFGYFPSVSAGWIMTQESFISENVGSWLDFAKLRLSWGQNGNEAIGSYRYIPTVNGNNGYTFGRSENYVSGTVPGYIANKDLQWETSEQTNVGLDLNMLGNKLTFNADYYIKTTQGLLITPPIPGFVGVGAPTANSGDVKNSGIELALGYRNHETKFTYGVQVNASTNKNEVTAIGNSEKVIHGSGFGTPNKEVTRATVGEPIGVFWGYHTDGVFQNQAEVDAAAALQPNARPGDLRFKDTNGDGILDSKDMSKIGTPYPEFILGLTLDAAFMGFDASMFIQSTLNNDIYNASRRMDLPTTNYPAYVKERWTGEGTTNEHPRVSIDDKNENFRVSDYFVEDASFVRLKNIQIGYTIPKSITSKAKIEKFRIYISGNDLITLTKYTGYNPELGAKDGNPLNVGIDRGVYPAAKSVLVGLNVTF